MPRQNRSWCSSKGHRPVVSRATAMSSQNHTVRFQEEDLTLFSAASGDRNPLHMSPEYASKTPYGQRVVFGALGALACLGTLPLAKSEKIKRFTADFHRPMFLDIDYCVAVDTRGDGYLARLLDGSTPLLTLTVAVASGTEIEAVPGASASHFDREEPALRTLAGISRGLRITGTYQADGQLLARVCANWNIRHQSLAEMLLWSSYFVGMELPGRQALFFRLAIDCSQATSVSGPLTFAAEVQSVNPAISQLRTQVNLTCSAGEPVAHGQITSFVRGDINAELSSFDGLTQLSDTLAGRVAVVVGASRGLGAATAKVLALRGAQVIAVSRSRAEFSGSLPDEAQSRISLEQGDASDPTWLDQVRTRLISSYGRLDFLICNAFPAIPALRLETAAFARIQNYLSHSTAMVTAPLCALLATVNESSGCVVVISSSAVEKPVREWPHYVAAKCAIEGYATVVPLQYPQARVLIVRPEKLLTEMTNTPIGRQNATPPMETAVQICNKLENLPPPGSVAVLHPMAMVLA
jgi:NAD(P)-dependent dehydrogenase (short-subunit alcohol dehydrogenase family)